MDFNKLKDGNQCYYCFYPGHRRHECKKREKHKSEGINQQFFNNGFKNVVKGGMARLVSPSEEAGVNHDSDECMGMFGPDELTDYYTEVFTLHREYLYSLPTTINNDSWMIDSGCGLHLTGNRKWLVDCSSTQRVQFEYVGGHTGTSSLSGQINLLLRSVNNSTFPLTLKDVNYVEDAETNLISVSQLLGDGFCSMLVVFLKNAK